MRTRLIGVALLALAFFPVERVGAVEFNNNPAFSSDLANPFFFGIGTGAILPEDLTASMTGSFFGIPFTGATRTRFDTGFAVDGVLGYQVNQYLAVQGEFGYAGFDVSSLTLSLSAFGETAGLTLGADGNVEVYAGFFNVIVTPVGIGWVTPYVGAGVGAANVRTKVTSLSLAGFPLPVGYTDNRTDLALQAIAGVDVALSERFSIGARYTYLWIDSGESDSISGCFCGLLSADGTVDDFAASTLMLTAAVDF